MHDWIEFNIHDRAGIRVATDAPTAPQLRDMLAPFLAGGIDQCDLTITGRTVPLKRPSHGEHDYRYTDEGLYIAGAGVQIFVQGDSFVLGGTRELLTSALPLIDRIMVTHGAAMIHAATVDYGGRGLCLPAWGGVGKTSTVAKLLRLPGVRFMGDDWAFLSSEGQLLGYAKPMFIKAHHRHIYPHLFARKRKPLVPSWLSKPVSELTTMVHPVVTRYPRVAGITRKWSPEHMMVTPQQAFPAARISTRAPLAVVVFVERFGGSGPDLEQKDPFWMVSRLIGNFHCEMTQYSREVITALAATGLVPIERLFGDKAAVLQSALNGKPCFLLRVPVHLAADEASDVIVEQIHKALAEAGIEPAEGPGAPVGGG